MHGVLFKVLVLTFTQLSVTIALGKMETYDVYVLSEDEAMCEAILRMDPFQHQRATRRELLNFGVFPARVDADGTAKPLTKLAHHPIPGKRVGPGIPLVQPEWIGEQGQRVPLT